MKYRILASAAALAALGATSACTNVSALDCEEIAEHARRISQQQQLKITEIRNARETSRNDREARCTAEATFSDESRRNLELRAYYQGENTMVEYNETGGGSSGGRGGSEEGSSEEGADKAERGAEEAGGSEEGSETRE